MSSRAGAWDPLGRNLRHLVTLIEDLNALGIAFVSLGEGIDATTPAGRLQLHILAALAEFERARIQERVKAGLARVKAKANADKLAPKLKRGLGALSEESMLKRAPRGYDEAHPAARWLKFQSFTVGKRLSDAEVTSARLTGILQSHYEVMLPLVRWLNTTLGLKPARAR